MPHKLFRAVFLNNTPLLDVRSPGEFAQGAFPQAINIPLLNDEERAQVGTCYAQKGQTAAIALGHNLVSGEVKKNRMALWIDFATKNPQTLIYCARGGLRSQIVQTWLQDAGISLPRIEGGYKALRGYLLEQIDHISPRLPLIVLGGFTGSGKTRLLKQCAHHIDLEALANHRGSAFGSQFTAQPTSQNFENSLAIRLIKLSRKDPAQLLLEDESHLIGKLLIPPVLFYRMSESPLLVLDTPIEERARIVLGEYVIDEWTTRYQHLPNGHNELALMLKTKLKKISKKLGGALFNEIAGDIDKATEQHMSASTFDSHLVWTQKLLTRYYDPMYAHHLGKNQSRVIYRGQTNDILTKILTQTLE
ncbi:MAG TPA: tRNA 2-selenouridine(34) synthase MnmH [bacterium]|nr:tRNA 2-selenouridine(34) synthase MnmH [bacterium]